MTSKSTHHQTNSAPDKQAPVTEAATVEANLSPSPGEMADLGAQLEAAKTDAEHWRDRCLRKAAELENYRKRTERERLESASLVKASVLIEFLPIVDACERALRSFKEEDSEVGPLQNYREGVELLYKQLTDTLSRLGAAAIEAKGQKFDPHLHEALSHLETLDYEENTVIEELRKGYLFKDRLLRPAQVIIASRPKNRKEEAPEGN